MSDATLLAEARAILGRQDPGDAARFGGVETYCVFAGQPRSGHSVVAALVNAHRHALVSHNLDALAYLRAGLGPDELLRLILARDRAFAAEGRRMGRYAYAVPDLWLGHYDELRVVGDKRAGATSRHLAEEPTLLRDLPARLGLPVCAIHHVRNPWDNVASIWQWEVTRRGRDLAAVAEAYVARSEAAAHGLAEAGAAIRLVRTFHEELIRDPSSVMRDVLAALSLPVDDAFLAACRRFVHATPRPTRHDVPWSAGLVEALARHARATDFLAHYRFDAD